MWVCSKLRQCVQSLNFWPPLLSLAVSLSSVDWDQELKKAMKDGSVEDVWSRCHNQELLSRTAAMFSESVCCLITHCGSHLPHTFLPPLSLLTCSGRGRCVWFLWPTSVLEQTVWRKTNTHFRGQTVDFDSAPETILTFNSSWGKGLT